MAKTLIQDIVKKKPPLEKPKSKETAGDKIKEKEKNPIIPPVFKTPRVCFPRICFPRFGFSWLLSKSKFTAMVFGFTILVAASLAVLYKFSSVSVEITPAQKFIGVEESLKAVTAPQKGELSLEVMQMSREETGSAVPTGKKQISRKAEGRIIIYNAFSSDPQTLIANTRFETPDGKIYRIDKAIIVPGTKVVEGKIIPGEKEVNVFADKPGSEYNIELVDFTIPGFANSAKYEKIYCRSKTPMKGGFVGEVRVITEEDINKLRTSLREKITGYFLAAAKNPKPEDFLFYENAKKIVFPVSVNGPKAGDESDLLELKEGAVFYGFLLEKTELNKAFAEKYFEEKIASETEMVNIEDLVFELKNFTPTTAVFNLSGTAHFSRKINEDSVKKDLIAGDEKPVSIFQKYPAIEKARIIFRPNWWKFIPNEPSRIAITIILKKEP